jgi:hypothetical protein
MNRMTTSAARLLAGLACALLLAAPALAQQEQADAPANGDIVVTGTVEQPTSSEVTAQARAITAPTGLRHEPLPRFEGRLCPGVFGLKGDFAGLMIDRLRYNAERLDLWLTEDDGTCRPNFIVAFVDDGQAALEQIEHNSGWLFQSLSNTERRELLAEDGPVRVWTTVQTRTRDGMPVQRRENLTDPPVVATWMAHSKIYLAIREDITQVIVLFDKRDVKGKTLVQLADYATMRGLARTRPVDGNGQAMDTILALFDPDASPADEMTAFDRAYLAAVYDNIPNIPGITKVLGVNRQLRLQAEQEDDAAEE